MIFLPDKLNKNDHIHSNKLIINEKRTYIRGCKISELENDWVQCIYTWATFQIFSALIYRKLNNKKIIMLYMSCRVHIIWE